MEGPEEFMVGSNDPAHQIVRGKRTKRQRSSSPYTPTSSNGCGGGGVGEGEGEFVSGEYNSSSISSPTTYSGIYESTEEEEEKDMANCLILLAQGEGLSTTVENITDGAEKCSTPKFAGMVVAAPTVTQTGFYVYDCKTCNRSFPSFQALGGHRASHKKPKATADDDDKNKALVVVSMNDLDHDDGDDYDDDGRFQLKKSNLDDPTNRLQISRKNNKGFHVNKAKIHECFICGSEFASGQALGGHMRRHRPNTANNTIESNNNSSGEIKYRNILPLDLNLPAPEDDRDDHHQSEANYQFASTQQALVFSAPARLVDCHY